jgi:hypothetical protein
VKAGANLIYRDRFELSPSTVAAYPTEILYRGMIPRARPIALISAEIRSIAVDFSACLFADHHSLLPGDFLMSRIKSLSHYAFLCISLLCHSVDCWIHRICYAKHWL